MFVKVKVLFEMEGGKRYTVSIGNPESQTIMQFSEEGSHIHEELFEVIEGSETIQVSVLSEGEECTADHMDIAVKDVVEQQSSEWILVKDHLKVTILFTHLEQAPDDWFDKGLSFLANEEKPWYLTAEDFYKFIKELMGTLSQKVSDRVSIPSTYWDNALQKIDLITAKVTKNLLKIQLDEGFSLVSSIDELLEQVLSSTDEQVDKYRLQLALKLQQLRKNVTTHLQNLSHSLSSKTELYRSQFEGTMNENKEALDKSVATAYSWAADKSASTSNWLAQAEKTTIINKIDALRLSGKEILERTQSKVMETRDKVVNTVTDTRDQVVSTVQDTKDHMVGSVQTKLSAADEALRVQLPMVAHPYVWNAVHFSQPYIETAVHTATPVVESARNNESVKKLENWVMGKKKDEFLNLLEKHKDSRAGSIVSALLEQASRVITEVSDYCVNEDYFSRNEVNEDDQKQEAVGVPLVETSTA